MNVEPDQSKERTTRATVRDKRTLREETQANARDVGGGLIIPVGGVASLTPSPLSCSVYPPAVYTVFMSKLRL